MTSKRKKLLLLFFIPEVLFIAFLVFNALFPLPPLKSYSTLVLARDGSVLNAYLSTDDKWRMETKIKDVSPDLVKAVLAKEDKYFYYHPGINLVAVTRAMFSNLFHLKRTSGASTITMQLAKMFTYSRRTYGNKFVEMFRAMQLESEYSKDEILTLYLSYLPYGGNIEGIKAASYLYFNKAPSQLSLAQNILLTVIPNRPNSLRMDTKQNDAQLARDKWIKLFKTQNTFKKAALDEALLEPVETHKTPIIPKAPHFCQFVKEKFQGNEIKTTLDPVIQKIAEKLLFNHVSRVKERNVSNGAVLVINNRTMEVTAYCGSADFNDALSDGQVNGIKAYRSPGSATKPILYTLAMDKGLISPKTEMLDVPTNLNGYAPENFDLKFRGTVPADFALVQSLNIPAVRLLNKYGYRDYIDFICRDAGFKQVKARQKQIGLSVILGGCEVSLEELTYFYTSFANVGRLKKLNYLLEKKEADKGKTIFSPEAAYLTLDILSQNNRPDIPSYMLDYTNLPRIAWKTGTSYGKKDAWAIGTSPEYTIGVWMGNFNGKGAPELSGTEMAVPLLFELFDEIVNKSEISWFAQPANVAKRMACRESGMPAGADCHSRVEELYIRNISPSQHCDLYKDFFVDLSEKIHFCTSCLPGNEKQYKKKKYPVYDPELMLYWNENKIKFTTPPPHNPQCENRSADDGPKIVSPSTGFQYYIDEDAPQQISLQAASAPGTMTNYWYIDDKFFKSGKAGEKIFFMPSGGKHKFTCTDEQGRTSSVEIVFRKM